MGRSCLGLSGTEAAALSGWAQAAAGPRGDHPPSQVFPSTVCACRRARLSWLVPPRVPVTLSIKPQPRMPLLSRNSQCGASAGKQPAGMDTDPHRFKVARRHLVKSLSSPCMHVPKSMLMPSPRPRTVLEGGSGGMRPQRGLSPHEWGRRFYKGGSRALLGPSVLGGLDFISHPA